MIAVGVARSSFLPCCSRRFIDWSSNDGKLGVLRRANIAHTVCTVSVDTATRGRVQAVRSNVSGGNSISMFILCDASVNCASPISRVLYRHIDENRSELTLTCAS